MCHENLMCLNSLPCQLVLQAFDMQIHKKTLAAGMASKIDLPFSKAFLLSDPTWLFTCNAAAGLQWKPQVYLGV